jgi:hypothetical protein
MVKGEGHTHKRHSSLDTLLLTPLLGILFGVNSSTCTLYLVPIRLFISLSPSLLLSLISPSSGIRAKQRQTIA